MAWKQLMQVIILPGRVVIPAQIPAVHDASSVHRHGSGFLEKPEDGGRIDGSRAGNVPDRASYVLHLSIHLRIPESQPKGN